MTALLAGYGHDDPLARAALYMAVLLVIARVGGYLSRIMGQPAVLGELTVGIVAGNLTLVGFPIFRTLADDPFINVLAGLGVMLLLFEVGLESTVRACVPGDPCPSARGLSRFGDLGVGADRGGRPDPGRPARAAGPQRRSRRFYGGTGRT